MNATSFEHHEEISDDLIHQRLAHFSTSRIRSAMGKITGFPLSDFKGHSNCEHCAKGGIQTHRSKKKGPSSVNRFTFFGECIATDLAGPFPLSTPLAFTYAIVFYDRFSKYIAIYYLKNKDSAGAKAAMQQFMLDHKSWLKEGRVHEWFTDNGTEFRSSDLDEFSAEFLIKRSYSVPYVHNTNPHAERAWGIVLRPVRILATSINGGEKW